MNSYWILTIFIYGYSGNSVSVTTVQYEGYTACQKAAEANKTALSKAYGSIVQTCTSKVS